ncbi:hypothetical protein LZG07_00060 [Microbacterium profundi]|nr:hypothetical protein [Microbacterium profundi]
MLIAPVNSAGQGYTWARAAERLPDVAAASAMFRGGDDLFGFAADHIIPAAALVGNPRWRSAQKAAVARRFTHVVVESGRHLFEPSGDVLRMIRELQDAGVRVALLWHGSDIRLPSVHAAAEPDSPFRGGVYPDTDVLEEIARAHASLGAESGVQQFVSTPDLLRFVPGARWLPVVVDPERWSFAAARPALDGDGPIRVVHAPTRAGLKGSDQIADIMDRLQSEGVVEYIEVRGTPSNQMPELYGSADIVLDQFLAGAYGVAACEALAAGRLVVSHVEDATRKTVQTLSGRALPIVQARWRELEDVIRAIAADRPRFAVHAMKGPDFIRATHDGTLSAQVLRSFLDS